ncbi:MAG: helix-turn-helix transcriptional regulator, partial [Pseudonocardiales bacterium]
MDPGWVTHLKAMSSVAGFDDVIGGLSQRFRVIRFDKPGCGLSDRDPTDVSLEGQVAAALAVADAAHAARFSVFGASQGGQVAVALAARYPERIRSLVLYGTCADGRELAPASVRTSLLDLVSAHWGLGSRVLANIFLSDVTDTDIEAFARLQRACASPQVARNLLEIYYATDVTAMLAQVRAPTAVLHREGDTATPFELGRHLASRIEGATLTALPGSGHLFYQGAWKPVLDAALTFLTADDSHQPQLTDREAQVARLVAAGLTTHEI